MTGFVTLLPFGRTPRYVGLREERTLAPVRATHRPICRNHLVRFTGLNQNNIQSLWQRGKKGDDMRKLILLIAAMSLYGCATSPLPPPPPPPPGSNGAVIEGGIPKTENARIARAYLDKNEIYAPFQDNLPFGLILLKPGDNARNQAVCTSFVNGIQSVTDVIQADPDANIILTYWLLKSPLSNSDLTDCGKLLAKYDFARASKLRASYGRATASGPIFLALQLNKGLTQPDGSPQQPYVALLDLSAQTAPQVAQATITWFSQVVTPEADAAAGPNYQPEKARGRSFFATVLEIARNIGGQIACDVLRKDNPATNINYTEITAVDPYLNLAMGTLRLFVRTNGIMGFGADVIGEVLCKPLEVALGPTPK